MHFSVSRRPSRACSANWNIFLSTDSTSMTVSTPLLWVWLIPSSVNACSSLLMSTISTVHQFQREVTGICVCMSVYAYVCTHNHVSIHICIHVSEDVCVYVCAWIALVWVYGCRVSLREV